jgi:hypothetical protein
VCSCYLQVMEGNLERLQLPLGSPSAAAGAAQGNGFREALNCGENNPPQAQILVSTASANNTRPVSQPTTSTFHSLVILHPH